MGQRHIVAVITAVTGDRVVVTTDVLTHVARHFILPHDILLEFLERVLKDPSDIFCDAHRPPVEYRHFYRLEDGSYVVAIVKVVPEGHFLASMYPTGNSIRRKHAGLRRLRR